MPQVWEPPATVDQYLPARAFDEAVERIEEAMRVVQGQTWR